LGTKKDQRYCPNDDAMVLAEKRTPNHILHLLLSIVTGGLWLLVWLFLSLRPQPYLCARCGEVTRANPPRRWRQAAR